MKNQSTFLANLKLFNFWFQGTFLFFIPKSLRYKSVKGELVLKTGGGSGLGRELAICFAKLGANILVWDINKSGLDETIIIINEANPEINAYSYLCDVLD